MQSGDRMPSPSIKGAELFIKVSMQYPASVVFQGIALSQVSRREGLNTIEIGAALYQDQARIAKLAKTADNIHIARGLTTTAAGKPFPQMTSERITGTIASAFQFADTANTLPDELQNTFLMLFPVMADLIRHVGRDQAEALFEKAFTRLVATNDTTETAPASSKVIHNVMKVIGETIPGNPCLVTIEGNSKRNAQVRITEVGAESNARQDSQRKSIFMDILPKIVTAVLPESMPEKGNTTEQTQSTKSYFIKKHE